jgi:hypothetical protein
VERFFSEAHDYTINCLSVVLSGIVMLISVCDFSIISAGMSLLKGFYNGFCLNLVIFNGCLFKLSIMR